MANKEAKAKKENNKNKKSFFKDFKAELKKVNWPTAKQLFNNTTAVITIVIITAVIVFVLDIVFETLNKHGVDKIKEVIQTENSQVENNTSEDTGANEEANAEENAGEETSTQENQETTTEETPADNNTTNNAE